MNNKIPPQRKSKKKNPLANVKLDTTKRIVIFSIATLILGSAQCSFFPMLDVCKRTPDLMMGLILAVALCDGAKSAMILAIGAGFFIDAIGGSSISLSPLLYFIYAAVIGAICEKVMKSFPTFLLLLLPSLIYRALCTSFMCIILETAQINGAFVYDTLVLEMISTFIFCLPIYFIMNLSTKPLKTHKKFSF